MQSQTVSVIIPAHNNIPHLKEALQSVFAQTVPPWEVLVIDNGSTIPLAEVQSLFPKIRYIKKPYANVTKARNDGLLLSQGNFIAFLDHDDVWVEDKIEKQLLFFEAHPEFDACIGKQMMFLEEGSKKPSWLKEAFLHSPQPGYLPSALMIRKNAFLEGFNEAFPLASDVSWFVNAKQQGVKLHHLEEVLVHRRIHENNLSDDYTSLHKDILLSLKDSLQKRRSKPHAC